MASVDQIDAQIEAEEKAENLPGVTDADKKKHEAAIAADQSALEKAKQAIDPSKKAFIELCKARAGKATPDVRANYGDTLVNLRQAVDDAEVANGAAVIKYPMAFTGLGALQTELLSAAKSGLTDYVYEQTGKHLDVKHLTIGATFDGGKVGVQVSGLAPVPPPRRDGAGARSL